MKSSDAHAPTAAAARFARAELESDFQIEAVHEYTDANGTALFWRVRARKLSTGEKWIRPMKLQNGRYRLGEPGASYFPEGKPLYNQYELMARPYGPVVVTEGELKVDRLARLGVLATTSGGAESAAKADWRLLSGRDVIIWPDNDAPGRRYADAVRSLLTPLNCCVRVLDVSRLSLPEKGDAVDWLAARPEATAAEILALPCLTGTGTADQAHEAVGADGAPQSGEIQDGDRSQASALVDFVHERVTLFHDENGDVYATEDATRETRRLDGRQFRDWMVANFYDETGKSAREQAAREALSTLSGLARFRGERLPVHVRVAYFDGCYYLDLGEPGRSRAVCIYPGGWDVVSDPPVRFLRPETMRSLPEPVADGTLASLWPLINVPEDARLLIVAWLIDCLRPETPFPILELIGEQGSAKSTTQTVLRRLIDPNACDLRAAPKTTEDVFVSAGVNWLVSYENISHLSAPMQDALCVLATGGGFAKRKLYSDADESVIVVKRPIVLNGISAAVTAQDLIDRAVSIELPVIRERFEMPDLWRAFESGHGELLGAVLNTMARALELLPRIFLPPEERPRLAEFARLGVAVATALGYPKEDFMAEFNASRRECIARTIDASPAAAALMDWFDIRGRVPATMSIKDLLHEVEVRKPSNADAWPRSPKGFGDALRRAAPALRQLGIEVRSLGKTGGTVRWTVEPVQKGRSSSPGSPKSPGLGGEESNSQDFRTFRTSTAEESYGSDQHAVVGLGTEMVK